MGILREPLGDIGRIEMVRIIIYLLLLLRFIAFAQAVLNVEIFLLGELQLVAKGQEYAFALRLS